MATAAGGDAVKIEPIASRGYTVRDVAGLLRVGEDKVRGWVKRGEVVAVNTADGGCRPRYVITPDALAAFLRGRQAGPPPKPSPRKKRTHLVDYYPG
jgi:hypothetical protein